MDNKNVTTGKPKVGGAVWRAPVGTALPENALDALNNAFMELGYCSEDGVTNNNSPESDGIKAWGGSTVYSYQSAKPDTFGFKLIEALNPNVLKAVYRDDNVTGDLDTGITVKANAKEQEEYSWIIDMVLRGGILKRVVIPQASITEIGEINYGDEDAVGYEITLTAVPDEKENTHYEYIQKPKNATAGTETEDTTGDQTGDQTDPSGEEEEGN